MIPGRKLLPLVFIVLVPVFFGCFEMIKRTEPPPWEGEKPRQTEPKSKPSSPAAKAPQSDTIAAKVLQPDTITIAHLQEAVTAESSPFPVPSFPPSKPVIGRPPAEINHYALWCIQHEMWKEAKTHLEKAATIDSMTASLQNNLGVVYEYLNLDEKAEAAYQRATALDPDNGTYRENYRRFKRTVYAEHKAREEAKTAPDTVKAVIDTVLSK